MADDGLGPTYNAQSCRECHQNVVTGGASQVAEHRTGRLEGDDVLRVARRLADPVARDLARHRRARRLPGRHPHLPHLDQHARRRLRRGDREQHAAGDPRRASRSACAARSCVAPVLEADGKARDRALRLEEPAREPRVVRRRRLPERDGHHEPAAARGEHLERTSVGYGTRLRSGARSRGRRRATCVAFADFMRSTKAPSRGPITADVQAGERCSATSAAPPATPRRS